MYYDHGECPTTDYKCDFEDGRYCDDMQNSNLDSKGSSFDWQVSKRSSQSHYVETFYVNWGVTCFAQLYVFLLLYLYLNRHNMDIWLSKSKEYTAIQPYEPHKLSVCYATRIVANRQRCDVFKKNSAEKPKKPFYLKSLLSCSTEPNYFIIIIIRYSISQLRQATQDPVRLHRENGTHIWKLVTVAMEILHTWSSRIHSNPVSRIIIKGR